MDIWKIIIEFIGIFLIIYAFYYFFTIRKCKNNKKYVPVEVNLILVKYKINTKKINLYSMIKAVCLITSLILSLSITIINYLSKNTILSILIGACFSLVLSIIIYGFIGKYYQRKSEDN